jgi:NTP pyrophosphatase (non-canonical NTP hydrolase)
MTPEQYRDRAVKRSPMLRGTQAQPEGALSRDQLALCAIGLTAEAGEVADIIKKHLFHGKPLNRTHLEEELGDVLWYLDRTLSLIGVSLEHCMSLNDAKLEERYPVGFQQRNFAGDVVFEAREGDPTP